MNLTDAVDSVPHRSGNAVLIAADVHRRLLAYQVLRLARYRVLIRRWPTSLDRDRRIYRPDLTIVDASSFDQSCSGLKHLRHQEEVIFLSEDPSALPSWAADRVLDVASLALFVGVTQIPARTLARIGTGHHASIG